MLSKQTKAFYIKLREKQSVEGCRMKANTTIFKCSLKLRLKLQPLDFTKILFERSSDFYYCSNAWECVLESALTAITLLGAAEWDNQMALQGTFWVQPVCHNRQHACSKHSDLCILSWSFHICKARKYSSSSCFHLACWFFYLKRPLLRKL